MFLELDINYALLIHGIFLDGTIKEVKISEITQPRPNLKKKSNSKLSNSEVLLRTKNILTSGLADSSTYNVTAQFSSKMSVIHCVVICI